MSDKMKMIEELKVIIKPYVQNQEAFDHLDENTDFIDDLKINSANLVDIILDIEDKYDIEIDNDSMEKMLTVRAALDVVNAKMGISENENNSKTPNQAQGQVSK